MAGRKFKGYRDENLQKQVLRFIDAAGHKGLTVAELRQVIPDDQAHHGWISGALSLLHGDLKIARLTEKREGCKVYVHPDFLDSRQAEAQGRNGPTKDELAFLRSMEGVLEYWLQVDSQGARFGTDLTKAERNKALFIREIKGIWEGRPS
jgi:hypothetical protein